TVALVLCFTAALASGPIPVADIIIAHGRVYTGNNAQPWAEAVAVRDGKIIAVGDEQTIFKLRFVATTVVEAGGHLVLPGFVDCHSHFISGSLGLGRVNLEGAKDYSEIQQRLRDYAAKDTGKDWVFERGWNYAMFGSESLPDKKYLDEIFPDRPVLLAGYDGHTYWANSKALALAGITNDTPDPPNGAIVRDPKTHEATGALKEAAHGLVDRIVPRPSRDENLAALRAGMKWANQHGLTRVHSA